MIRPKIVQALLDRLMLDPDELGTSNALVAYIEKLERVVKRANDMRPGTLSGFAQQDFDTAYADLVRSARGSQKRAVRRRHAVPKEA